MAIPNNLTEYTDSFDLDFTTGLETKLVFRYNYEINVTIQTLNNNFVKITKTDSLNIIVAEVEGIVVIINFVSKWLFRISLVLINFLQIFFWFAYFHFEHSALN